MAKHQIKHRWNNSVIFECDVPGDMKNGQHARYALERAAKSGAHLSDANLSGANLTDANLSYANLSYANLSGANLTDANLSYANLIDANLSDANLIDANLSGANLTDANLSYANFSGANLSGAKWSNGIVINKPPIQLFGFHWRVTILDEHMQIGCELHKLSDWAVYEDKRICEMDGRDALRFWRAHKDALLGLAKGAGRMEVTDE